MSCEHLICAHCTNPVIEGHCPACRAARQHVHHQHFSASPQLLIATIVVLTALLFLAMHLGT
ncbi:MAG: hypothetical protein ACRDPY_42520 [Streptosporangiaceae bacterium]